MNIIAVDDEPLALASLIKQLEAVFPEHSIRGFSSPSEALAAMRAVPADIAFLDVEMAGLNGLQLGLCFKKVNPPINIIFVTAHAQYALDAIQLRASGYILKPATQEALREEVRNLRMPGPPTHRVVVRTFGSFEVLVDGSPLHFARSKSKELFALLIDREGKDVPNATACALLWPGKECNFSLQRQLQTVIGEMCKAFSACGAEGVIVRNRHSLAVDTAQVDCDVYRMKQGDMRAFNAFQGKYMEGYPWAAMPDMN